MDPAALSRLSAGDAARLIRGGALVAEELVRACLERIREREPQVQASNGLLLGARLVGRRGFDARLLRTARWLVNRLDSSRDGKGAG